MTISHLAIALLVRRRPTVSQPARILTLSHHSRFASLRATGRRTPPLHGLPSGKPHTPTRRPPPHRFSLLTALVSCVYLFTAAYGASYGPVGWVLPSEVFPLSVRSRGVALSTASNWLNNCASSPPPLKGPLLT